MKLSTLFGRTLRDAPSEADTLPYQLALRAALVRSIQSGSFALMPFGMRALRRIEAIMHEELEAIDAQEFRTPVVQAAGVWERSGRLNMYGPLILQARDRSERSLLFAPTHEEAIAELARREIPSYRQLPAIVYQIHTKYRDEVRARGGLMRMREFTMLDAYSLDADAEGLDESYALIAGAFERIFERCGVRFVAVEASAGEMGGREPREYMAISDTGEDVLAICANCGYAANAEVATYQHAVHNTAADARATPAAELVATPGCITIADVAAFLGVPASATAKAVFFHTAQYGLIFAVVRGDREVSETKLRALLGGIAIEPASAEQIMAAGAVPGYASPVGLHVRNTAAEAGVFVVADTSVTEGTPLAAGANRAGYHLRNAVYGRDWHATLAGAISEVQAGDACVRCGAPLAIERGVEIGHIFKLGTRYTEALDAVFLDRNGTTQPIVMGSYGIGLERMLHIILDQHHDERGIVWPRAVAPFDVHLVRLGKSEDVRAAADELYGQLREAGVSVLYDDRDESAGVKFNDADLLGLPVRVLISERLLAQNLVEIKPRQGQARQVGRAELLGELGAAEVG
ncbi:MAG TPA: proline--tRNA ligase [Roseiflexaceae bacterium]|nr:proline--tRNA ligase [Roseiflexaceae bacterium]